jgi:tyrosyl-tRNA synthetase
MRPVEEQVQILMQGTEYGDIETKKNMEDELRARLTKAVADGRPLRVYCGFDPTATDLHLGHTVPLFKLRQFQDLGHDVTFLIGSFTATIGDPSDKDKLRPTLNLEKTIKNAKTYTDQAFRVLDKAKTTIQYNHTWLGELSFSEVIALSSNFTVQQFLSRDNFRKRYDAGQPVYLHEFFYALMQGYDAVALETDVQVGGTDQLFNIVTAGRKLQTAHGQEPQIAVINAILPGTDGVIKMSKSLGNHIPIYTTAEDMYGKVMSVPDEAMPLFFELVSRYEPPQVEKALSDLKTGARHPKEIKMELARAIVRTFYGDEGAEAGEAHFKQVHEQGELPDDMPAFSLQTPTLLVDILAETKLAKSKGEARRLIKQGGVRLDGDKVSDLALELQPTGEQIVQVGKRRFLRITV